MNNRQINFPLARREGNEEGSGRTPGRRPTDPMGLVRNPFGRRFPPPEVGTPKERRRALHGQGPVRSFAASVPAPKGIHVLHIPTHDALSPLRAKDSSDRRKKTNATVSPPMTCVCGVLVLRSRCLASGECRASALVGWPAWEHSARKGNGNGEVKYSSVQTPGNHCDFPPFPIR